jgi:uncharacterized membrane protein (DUF485 family)
MSDEKIERLGLRGRLAHWESGIRLLGGANTTGAIAAGAAFHAFDKNVGVQNAVATAAVLFLFGIFAFIIAYVVLFVATDEVDQSLHEGEPTWPEYLWWVPTQSAEEYKKAAHKHFVVAAILSLASFILFIIGFAFVLFMAVRLTLGS